VFWSRIWHGKLVFLKTIFKEILFTQKCHLDIYICSGTPLARPSTGRHWIGRVNGARVVALVDFITLAFLKVSCISFPNVHITVRIYLSMTICGGEGSFSKLKRIKYEVRICMGQQRLSFLFLMSIENDIAETLTVACREKGEQGDVPRHPRQGVIKRMKRQKVKGFNWTFFLL